MAEAARPYEHEAEQRWPTMREMTLAAQVVSPSGQAESPVERAEQVGSPTERADAQAASADARFEPAAAPEAEAPHS